MDSNFSESPISTENLWSYGGNRCPCFGSGKLFLQAGIGRKRIIMEDPQPIARGHYLRSGVIFGGLREGIADVARTPNWDQQRIFGEVFSNDDLSRGQGRSSGGTHIADDQVIDRATLCG